MNEPDSRVRNSGFDPIDGFRTAARQAGRPQTGRGRGDHAGAESGRASRRLSSATSGVRLRRVRVPAGTRARDAGENHGPRGRCRATQPHGARRSNRAARRTARERHEAPALAPDGRGTDRGDRAARIRARHDRPSDDATLHRRARRLDRPAGHGLRAPARASSTTSACANFLWCP